MTIETCAFRGLPIVRFGESFGLEWGRCAMKDLERYPLWVCWMWVLEDGQNVKSKEMGRSFDVGGQEIVLGFCEVFGMAGRSP